MTTLITMGKGITPYVRTCDAKCHNAKGIKCGCICEGKLHGIGSKKAAEVVREIWSLGSHTERGVILIAPVQRKIELMEVET